MTVFLIKRNLRKIFSYLCVPDLFLHDQLLAYQSVFKEKMAYT